MVYRIYITKYSIILMHDLPEVGSEETLHYAYFIDTKNHLIRNCTNSLNREVIYDELILCVLCINL